MKHNKLSSAITALITSALLITAMPITVFAEGEAAETSSTEIVIQNDGEEAAQTTQALREGDTYAITKLSFKGEQDGIIPGGYQCVQIDEENQQAVYTNGSSRIVVLAQNYKENMQELDIFADNACALLRIRNFTSACDTLFNDPVETKVDGFRAIMYDYDILQYEFIDETTKQQIDTFKGRNYYFYSDSDVYAFMFDTNDETWEEQSKCFEEFVDAVEIAGSKNVTLNQGAIALIVVAVAAVIAFAISFAVIRKKNKKAE